MPSLFDVQMRENELRNPNARSYREVGSPEFERELDAMVQSRAGITQGGSAFSSPEVQATRSGILGQPIQSGGSVGTQLGQRARGGLLAAKDFARGVTYPFRVADQFLNETVIPAAQGFGQEFVASATDTPISPLQDIDTSNIPERRETISPDNSDEENAGIVLTELKGPNAKDVDPKAVAAAAATTADAIEKNGGKLDIPTEAPEGVDKGVWKGFNDQFDLTTIGLTLMATSSNGQSLGANLGLALQAGMAAKQGDGAKDRKIRKEEADIAKTMEEVAALARENAGGSAAEQETQRLDDEKTKAEINKLNKDAVNAVTGKPMTATQNAIGLSWLQDETGDKDVPAYYGARAAQARTDLIANGVTDPNTQDGMIKDYFDAQGWTKQGWWGGTNIVSASDR